MTEEDKLRLKILKIKFRRMAHRGLRMSAKAARKIGLVTGLMLISISGSKAQSFKELLASAREDYKSNKELFAWVEKKSQTSSEAGEMVSKELSNQIHYLVEELMYARNDSLISSIDRLRNPKTRLREIRNNFKDAVGTSRVAFHCLATQCAADWRALKAMGLEAIIPQDLRSVSALCRAYASNPNIKPFVYEVENTDEAIKACIQEHNLSGGCLVFYPRDRQGNYHAVALDMPKDDFLYNDGIDEILTSSANNERKEAPIQTESFRKKAPYRKALVIDKFNFFVAMLERHIEGKTLAEQTAFLYRGGADEFVEHLQRVTGQKKEYILADIGNTVKTASHHGDNRASAGLYLLALIPCVTKRKSNNELFDGLAEMHAQETIMDKIEYLNGDSGKKFRQVFAELPTEERQMFFASINETFIPHNGVLADANNDVSDAYALSVFNFQQQWLSTQTWHEVAPVSKKTSLKEQGKKTSTSKAKTTSKALPKAQGHEKA